MLLGNFLPWLPVIFSLLIIFILSHFYSSHPDFLWVGKWRLEPDAVLTNTVFIMLFTGVLVTVHSSWTVTLGPFLLYSWSFPMLHLYTSLIPAPAIPKHGHCYWYLFGLFYSNCLLICFTSFCLNFHHGGVSLLICIILLFTVHAFEFFIQLVTVMSGVDHIGSDLSCPLKVWVNSLWGCQWVFDILALNLTVL